MPGCKVGDKAIVLPGKFKIEEDGKIILCQMAPDIIGVIVNVLAVAQNLYGLRAFRVARADGKLLNHYERDSWIPYKQQPTSVMFDAILQPIRGISTEENSIEELNRKKAHEKDIMISRVLHNKI